MAIRGLVKDDSGAGVLWPFMARVWHGKAVVFGRSCWMNAYMAGGWHQQFSAPNAALNFLSKWEHELPIGYQVGSTLVWIRTHQCC